MVKKYFIFILVLLLVFNYSYVIITAEENYSFLSINQNSIQFVYPSDISLNFINRSYILFNITANSSSQANISIFLYNSSLNLYAGLNNSGQNIFYSNFSNLSDGIWFYNSSVYNSTGLVNSTITYNITIDTISPNISVISPIDSGIYYVNQTIYLASYLSENSSVWFTNDSGITNVTMTKTSSNNYVSFPSYLNYSSSGTRTLTFYANDSSNNIVSKTISLNLINLPINYTIANSQLVNVTENMTNIIVPYNTTIPNITISPAILSTQMINLDLSQLIYNRTITLNNSNKINLIRIGSVNYSIDISGNNNITSELNWDGKIILPIINTTTFTPPSGTTNLVIEVGSPLEINFSSPVKIIIGGMTGKRGAWSRGNTTLNDIPAECNDINNPSNINPTTTRECYTSSDGNLIIWSYHLSSFAAYTRNTSEEEGDSSSSGSTNSSADNFWINTQTISEKQFTNGFTRELFKKYRVQVNINKKLYYVGLADLSNTTATINITAISDKTIFNIGDEKKFDINNDNIYDIYVKLNGIKNSKANLTIKKTTEPVPVSEKEDLPTTSPITTQAIVDNNKTNQTALNSSFERPQLKIINMLVFIALTLIVIGLIFLFRYYRKYSKKKVETKIKVLDI